MQGRLCAQIYLAIKYFPNGFSVWEQFLENSQAYLCAGFRGNFDDFEWHMVILFQALLILLDLYEGKYDGVQYCGKYLERRDLRTWMTEIIDSILEYDRRRFG